MENEKPVKVRDLLMMTGITVGGFLAIHWILRHPDAATRAQMRVFLTTQKVSHGISDGFRVIADKAGTQYNRLRVSA